MSYSFYKSGMVISSPDFDRVHVKRSSAPQDKIFSLSFKAKMKIFDGAYHQHTALKTRGFNHVFLTPTFDMNDYASWSNGNEAIKRFTDNLKKTYGASSYLWVREFTQNIVPHYHMLVTMPYADIKDLNRSWSIARGDIDIVPNALRTGWNKKTRRPVMKIHSLRKAVGYCAKYVSKGMVGDVSLLSNRCNIEDRKTWEYKTGHSVKCYGLSNNINFSAKSIDFSLFTSMYPESRKKFKFEPKDNCDIFLTQDRHTLGLINQFADYYGTVKKKSRNVHAPPKKNPKVIQKAIRF